MINIRISKTFPEPVGKILDNFEISIKSGEIIALLGPSGCGKTTILNLIASIAKPDPSERSVLPLVSMSYAFQRPELIPWRNCEENVYFESDVLNINRKEIKKNSDNLFDLLRLAPFKRLYPEELSLGMQQRIQLIKVINRNPQLLLLDEPLGAVDQPLRILIASKMKEYLHNNNMSALWITHDSLEAIIAADRVLIIGRKPLSILNEYRPQKRSLFFDNNIDDPKIHNINSSEDEALIIRNYLIHSYKDDIDINESLSKKILKEHKTVDKINVKTRILPIFPLVIFLLLWQLITIIYPATKFFISAPLNWIPLLYSELINNNLSKHIAMTIEEAVLGLIIGLILGIILGYLFSLYSNFSYAIRPYLIGLTAVPLFVLAPAFILWFGIGIKMKIAIASLSCFPIIAISVHDSAIDSKGNYFKFLEKEGAPTKQLYIHLVIPNSIKNLFSSLRYAAVTSLIGAFLGEFIAANAGLGYYIIYQSGRYRIAEVIVGVVWLFSIAIGVDYISKRLAENSKKIINLFHL